MAPQAPAPVDKDLSRQLEALDGYIATLAVDDAMLSVLKQQRVVLAAQLEQRKLQRRAEKPVAKRRAEVEKDLEALVAKKDINAKKLEEAEASVRQLTEIVGRQRGREETLRGELRELALREAEELQPDGSDGDVTDEEAQLEKRLSLLRARRKRRSGASLAPVTPQSPLAADAVDHGNVSMQRGPVTHPPAMLALAAAHATPAGSALAIGAARLPPVAARPRPLADSSEPYRAEPPATRARSASADRPWTTGSRRKLFGA